MSRIPPVYKKIGQIQSAFGWFFGGTGDVDLTLVFGLRQFTVTL